MYPVSIKTNCSLRTTSSIINRRSSWQPLLWQHAVNKSRYIMTLCHWCHKSQWRVAIYLPVAISQPRLVHCAPFLRPQPWHVWKECAFFQKTSFSIFCPTTPVAYFLFAALFWNKAFRIASASQHLSSLYIFASLFFFARDDTFDTFSLKERYSLKHYPEIPTK
jgi:hypothetical protein